MVGAVIKRKGIKRYSGWWSIPDYKSSELHRKLIFFKLSSMPNIIVEFVFFFSGIQCVLDYYLKKNIFLFYFYTFKNIKFCLDHCFYFSVFKNKENDLSLIVLL